MGKKKISKKCHNQQKELDVLVASWACEGNEILTQRSTGEAFWVRITMASQAQLATKN